jgi:5-methylcytosine-specific restriction endonuclease McrA
MSNYQQLLRNPFWQAKRLEIFQRDKFTCTKCQDKFTNLQVHHTFYDHRLPWEYPNDSMFTVCELCHEKEEFYKWIDRNYWRLRKDDFDNHEIKCVVTIIKQKVEANKHAESVHRYMADVKILIHG